jgi:uncharacterized protein with von Willebrand factor type A (vWA) domain
MEKQEAQEILVNAMGSLFAEAEIEAGIAEAAGISREKYNKIIEDGLELPEAIKKYRENNRKRKYFEEKLITHELKESGELLIKPTLILVFSHFPQFQQDYELLKSNGYLNETVNGLEWTKTKKSLAEYFGNLPRKIDNVQWKDIENLFDAKGLKNSFSPNGTSYTKKQSKDYEELLKILPRNTPKGK